MKVTSLAPVFGKLNRLLTFKQKVYLLILLLMTMVFSIIETAGVSAVMPFISAASNPQILNGGIYKSLYDFFKFESAEQFIIFFGILIISFYLFRAFYNVVYLYLLNRYSFSMCRYLAKKLFGAFLRLPYKLFTQRNSAEIIQVTNNETNSVSVLLQNVLMLFSETFTVLFLYVFIIIVNWRITFVLTASLALVVICVLNFLVKRSKNYGIKRVEANEVMYRTSVETFGNFKFIKLKSAEEKMERRFDDAAARSNNAQIMNNTLSSAPKCILESIGFSLLVLAVIYILRTSNSPENVLPVIVAYALALYKILPSVNRMLQNVTQIAYNQHSLDIVYNNIKMESEITGAEKLEFNNSIKLKNITFSYVNSAEVINNVSLEIKKGVRVAFVGESGSGKSTLIDIITGIYKPVSGSLIIDETEITYKNINSWKKIIGYIPQDIYLFDGTVGENVAFGSAFNKDKIRHVLETANIWSFLETKNGIDTKVGEDGIQLSGGQKQRIGIARALYDNPEVIILDEATSALDNETEAKIMDEIYHVSENKTLIVVAHRLSTVERCDKRIKIDNGKIAE